MFVFCTRAFCFSQQLVSHVCFLQDNLYGVLQLAAKYKLDLVLRYCSDVVIASLATPNTSYRECGYNLPHRSGAKYESVSVTTVSNPDRLKHDIQLLATLKSLEMTDAYRCLFSYWIGNDATSQGYQVRVASGPCCLRIRISSATQSIWLYLQSSFGRPPCSVVDCLQPNAFYLAARPWHQFYCTQAVCERARAFSGLSIVGVLSVQLVELRYFLNPVCTKLLLRESLVEQVV